MNEHMRIGVVEDNREDYLALKRVLGPSVELQRWQTAEQAIASLAAREADDLAMIFIDGNLPGMHGADLVREIRSTPSGRLARLAVFSGSADPSAPARAMDAGADLFVRKGATLEEFKDGIARCLTGARQPV